MPGVLVPRMLVLGMLAAAGLAGGCTVGPAYHAPAPDVPAAWHDPAGSDAAAARAADPAWWRRFGDPLLDGLVARATAGNPAFLQTIARIAQARAQEQAQRAAGLPSLTGSALYTRERLGEAGLFTALGSGQPGAAGQPGFAGGIGGLAQGLDLYQVGFDASWELDLFGRVRRAVEQAHAQLQAQLEASRDALLTLQGDVARAYLQVRAGQALRAQAAILAAARARALDLTRIRRAQGLADDTELDQARAALLQAQAQTPQLDQQVAQAINRLAVLTGQAPGTLAAALQGALAAPAPLPALPDRVAIALPAAITRRRPDIRQAEASLHAATAETGVAVAQLYPDITLSGQVGQRSLTLPDLAQWANTFYQFGPAISLPLFSGGRLRAGVALARARQREAALAYRQAVLTALQQVEDELAALRTDRDTQARDAAAIGVAAGRLDLARVRYRDGIGDALAVQDSMAALATARQDDVRARLQVLLDAVALYKAMGGGWE
ncbi:efflux transporter outer membrane subunit [Nguyenibacter sp. L1]|uniref:efflux transporter outer membrane subunit n=1 Tax=Nguyenibacter sp. L1 TaxID=3049350 RepID=UPI002B46C6E0|nr:efflux transporter outer membrane subunit [Nguyenibacter sp. L1]